MLRCFFNIKGFKNKVITVELYCHFKDRYSTFHYIKEIIDFIVLSQCITMLFANNMTPSSLAPPTALLFLCSYSLSKAMNIIKVCSF